MTTTVAFLGLGAMGTPMAANLAQAGFRLRVWNRTPVPDRVPKGAWSATTPREAAEGAAFAVSMLANDDAVEAVTNGPDGLLAGLDGRGVHIGMSTISPGLSRRLTEAHAARGGAYVAAPVFGRPDAAKTKALWIVTGGEPSDLERCRPVLEALGQGIFPMGAPDQASLAKLVGNFLLAATIEALGEGFALAEKGGLDPARLLDMLVATLFGSPVVKNYGTRIVRGEFVPPGFTLPLGLKDLLLARAAGRELGVPLPLADVITRHINDSIAKGRAGYDFAGFTQVIREAAGLPEVKR